MADLAEPGQMTPAAVQLAAYRPPDFQIPKTRLHFMIAGDMVEVTARLQIERTSAGAADLRLDGGPDMVLHSVALDGMALDEARFVRRADHLLIHDMPARAELVIVTRLRPAENTRLEGLYASGDMLSTQCEAEGFRHITYFLDRPDVLSVYDVRIEADKAQYPVLLSNGNPGAEGDLPGGRHFAEWHDPHPKPSYLFALVAGPLEWITDHFTTMQGRAVTLNCYARPGDAKRCRFALGALKRAMQWDEERFGRAYDLDVYNIVAVSDFNMGAMENKGLNIFNTKFVIADTETATDVDFDNVEGVIGHEYFHNWSGNRVTCRDWFQLSLKEGLTVYRDQEFSSDMGSRAIKRLDDVRLLRTYQFAEDAGPFAHPVRPAEYIEINNFYTATVYNKGAELIRMMVTLVGEAAFRRGMDLYFERHDGQAVTCEDFVAAIADASGRDFSSFMRWYLEKGTPRVHVRSVYEGDTLALHFSTDVGGEEGGHIRPIPIALGWVGAEGAAVQVTAEEDWRYDRKAGTFIVELTRPEQVVRFKTGGGAVVPSLLRGFSAPIRLEDDLDAEDLVSLVRHDSDFFVRTESMNRLAKAHILQAAGYEPEIMVNTSHLLDAAGDSLARAAEDPALTAILLGLPGDAELAQAVVSCDPLALRRERDALESVMATSLYLQIEELYGRASYSAEGETPGGARARRRLRGRLLLLLSLGPNFDPERLLAQYETADNATDRIAALRVACLYGCAVKDDLLARFDARFGEDPLQVDRYFSLQAESVQTLAGLEALLLHDKFNWQNPNRIRSVLAAFPVLNIPLFHQQDGTGYQLLADSLLRIDRQNPQLAARLVTPLSDWRRMAAPYSEEMRHRLVFMQQQQGLSRNTTEMLSRALNESQ